MTSATASSSVLLPRTGPRPLVTLGMVLAAAGMVLLAQLGVDSTYAAHVVPGLIVVGLGLGLVMAPSTNTATRDAVAKGCRPARLRRCRHGSQLHRMCNRSVPRL